MFCKKCGASINGEGTICPNCIASSGTGYTPAKLEFGGTQILQQKNAKVKGKIPLKKILIPLTAVILAAVLVFGGITVYGMVFSNPVATIYDAIEKTLQASNASFTVDANGEDEDESFIGKGFYSLGKDVQDSIAYLEVTETGNGKFVFGMSDGKYASSDFETGDVDDLINSLEDDFESNTDASISLNDVVKNKKLNFYKLEEMYKVLQTYAKKEGEIELPEYKEVLGVLQDFFMKECKKKAVREQFVVDFERESVSGGKTYSFTLDLKGFSEAFGAYLASLNKYNDLYQIAIDDINDPKYDSIDKIFEEYFRGYFGTFVTADISLSITVSKGYVTEIDASAKANGEKISANLQIDEINKLEPNQSKVDKFIKSMEEEQY